MRNSKIYRYCFLFAHLNSLILVGLLLACIFTGSNACAQDSVAHKSLSATISEVESASDSSDKNIYSNPKYFDNIPVEENVKPADTAAINQSFRQIDKKYKSADFNYKDNRINRLSWWERLQRRVASFFQSLFPDLRFTVSRTFFYILIFIGLVALAYIIYRLLSHGKQPLFREDQDKGGAPSDWIEKKLMDINLETNLERTLAEKDYAMAIRYLHLINLKALAQSGQIEWDYKKTNHDFLYELNNEQLKKAFGETIRIFEYVWYGGFVISEEDFAKYRRIFEAFKAKISKKKNLASEQQNVV